MAPHVGDDLETFAIADWVDPIYECHVIGDLIAVYENLDIIVSKGSGSFSDPALTNWS